MSDETLSNLMHEERRFAPPEELAANANVTADWYDKAAEDREGFWAEQAERLDWEQRTRRYLCGYVCGDATHQITTRSRYLGCGRD